MKTIFASLFALCLIFSLTPAFASDMGPLEPIIQPGADDYWSVEKDNGSVVMKNPRSVGDVIYYYVNETPGEAGRRTFSVDIEILESQSNSLAGLLYGFAADPRSYFLFTIGGDQSANLHYLGNGQFEQKMKTSLSDSGGKSVHLMIQEDGNTITLFVDGREIGSFGNDRIGYGALGIVAADVGAYRFSNFDIRLDGSSGSLEPENPAKVAEPPAPQSADLTYLDFIDKQNGMVQHRAPFPPGWRYDTNLDDQLLLIGPNGTQVYQSNSGQLVYSDDPYALQTAQASGAQIAPMMPLEQFLQQQIAPYMAQNGFELTNSYSMPKLRDFWETFAARMPQGLSRRYFDALGAEWQNTNGSRAFTVLVQNLFQRQNYTLWSVNIGELYASNPEFEKAKKAYIHGLTNTEVNPQWQIAKNNELLAQLRANAQVWDERMRQSRMQHIVRMNSILARSETSSSIAKINSDILDSSHAGYLKRSDMVSAGQASLVNSIGEHSVIGNPETGEYYKVDAGYKNYWVNQDGKYFHTDNSLYDPRTDNQMNDQQWTRFEIVD